MTQPNGFVLEEQVSKVYKLQRSFYGLKQTSKSLNIHFDEAITDFDFIKSEDESSMYKKVSKSIVTFSVLSIDGIMIIENDIPNLYFMKA